MTKTSSKTTKIKMKMKSRSITTPRRVYYGRRAMIQPSTTQRPKMKRTMKTRPKPLEKAVRRPNLQLFPRRASKVRDIHCDAMFATRLNIAR
jgi:hypothetical protein